jgi:hypothetical protein
MQILWHCPHRPLPMSMEIRRALSPVFFIVN